MDLKTIFKLLFILIVLTIYVVVFGRVSLSDHFNEEIIITYREEELQKDFQPG